MSAGPLVKLIVGAKTSDLNPFFFPPSGHPHTLLTSLLQHRSCISFHLRQGKEAASEPDAPREGWKSGPPTPGAPDPSPCAAGSWGAPGVKPSSASQPRPSRHQLGQGMFPRCPVLFRQGQGCACPPAALGLVQASSGRWIFSERTAMSLVISEQGRCTQAAPPQHSGSCVG